MFRGYGRKFFDTSTEDGRKNGKKDEETHGNDEGTHGKTGGGDGTTYGSNATGEREYAEANQ